MPVLAGGWGARAAVHPRHQLVDLLHQPQHHLPASTGQRHAGAGRGGAGGRDALQPRGAAAHMEGSNELTTAAAATAGSCSSCEAATLLPATALCPGQGCRAQWNRGAGTVSRPLNVLSHCQPRPGCRCPASRPGDGVARPGSLPGPSLILPGASALSGHFSLFSLFPLFSCSSCSHGCLAY